MYKVSVAYQIVIKIAVRFKGHIIGFLIFSIPITPWLALGIRHVPPKLVEVFLCSSSSELWEIAVKMFCTLKGKAKSRQLTVEDFLATSWLWMEESWGGRRVWKIPHAVTFLLDVAWWPRTKNGTVINALGYRPFLLLPKAGSAHLCAYHDIKRYSSFCVPKKSKLASLLGWS